jgi:hypothetical protein
MRKFISLCCLLIGSACLGIGGSLLVTGLFPLEGIFCILLSTCWLYLAEAGFTQQVTIRPKEFLLYLTRKA